MMRKKWLPHIIAAVSLAVFVVLGLASDGGASTPSSYSSDGGGGYTSQEEIRYIVWVSMRKPDGGIHQQQFIVYASTAREAEAEARQRAEAGNPSFTFISASASPW